MQKNSKNFKEDNEVDKSRNHGDFFFKSGQFERMR